MPLTRPAATLSDGNVTVLWVPTLTLTAPTVAQLTAAAVKNISCYLTGDGLGIQVDETEVADSRLCDTKDVTMPGRTKTSITLKYTRNYTTAGADEAAIALVKGTSGYLVVRYGLANDAAFAAAQKMDVYAVTCGYRVPVAPVANSVLMAQQKMFVTGEQIDAVAA